MRLDPRGDLGAVAGTASIFPWQLGQETSVMFGLIFLGAATYFIYGALDPHWGNAVGLLAGFLAYDLVLLAPYLERFSLPAITYSRRTRLESGSP